MQDLNRILRGFFLARHQNRLSRAAISNADFYHLIKGRISYIDFFWKADKIPLQNRQYRSLLGNGNCLANLWPNFTGHTIIFRLRILFHVDPESILYFFGETRVKERDGVEWTDSLVGTEPEADNVMIQINLICSTCKLRCYHVDKFPVFIITGPPSATLPCKTNLDMISLVIRFPSPGFLCGCVLHQLQTWSVFLLKYYKNCFRTYPRW